MPSRIDNYVCYSKLGAGATATVWKAQERDTGREVALKVLDKSNIMNDAAALK